MNSHVDRSKGTRDPHLDATVVGSEHADPAPPDADPVTAHGAQPPPRRWEAVLAELRAPSRAIGRRRHRGTGPRAATEVPHA